jgi:GTPase
MKSKAVLVGLQLTGTTSGDLESSLAELQRLVETLGFEVIGKITQKRAHLSATTAIGEGKLKELAKWTGGSGKLAAHSKTTGIVGEAKKELIKEEQEDHTEEPHDPSLPYGEAQKVIFDHELTPNQLRNLELATGVEVLDRTGVIVEIFHRHAKTREAQLQVEIARLKYLAPRIRATGAAERQGGGIGSKGIGETSYELDRRRIRDKVAELQEELKGIQESGAQRRSRRQDQLRIALVGYTNAGKSSLMRALTGDQVLVADKLFATLDTTVRALQPDLFPRILVSDTVGFIKKLPHDLVASFRSTLEEAGDASLLLYVVDASDPDFRAQLEVTQTVLKEIGADDIPSLLILNKRDRLDIAQVHLLAREYPAAVQISTRDANDTTGLTRIIREQLTAGLSEETILIRYDDKKGLLGEIRNMATVLEESFEAEGVRLKIRTYPENLASLKKRMSSS